MPSPRHPSTPYQQRGASLLIFVVIMVVGIAALLVGSLNSSALNTSRQQQTAAALAQAKDALIGYAVSDANRPGELPCPDFNNDGMITPSPDYSGSNCASLVGWLPWQTLGLPDLRDGNGDRLWYAVANPFHANSNAILNSDTPTTLAGQMLTVNDGASGGTLASGAIAIIFSPGTPLAGETRSPSDNNAINAIVNYLDGSNASPNSIVFQTANGTIINDRLLAISSSNLFPPVERRIAREAKSCLDTYAAASASKYPWAAPVGDASSLSGINGNYTGVYGKYFGRLPAQPNIEITPTSSPATTLMTALNALQTALSAFNASGSSANYTALYSAASTVSSLENSVSGVSSSTIDQAGDSGKSFANGNTSYATATSKVTTAVNALASYLDLSMSIAWPASCAILNNPSSYFWTSWKNLVFYQTANGYQPGGGASCTTNTTCLTVSGSGNTATGNGTYRAAVLIARAAIGSTQIAGRNNPATSPPTPYLANNTSELSSDPAFVTNAHTNAALTTTFITYGLSDPYYQKANDLVLCLDGKVNCL